MLSTLLTVLVVGVGGFSGGTYPQPDATVRVSQGSAVWLEARVLPVEGQGLRVRLPDRRKAYTITARLTRAPEAQCFPQRVRLHGRRQTVTVKCSIK